MARTLRIEWRPGRKVTGRLAMPGDPIGAALLLAHGAGAGQDHPFVAGLRDRLCAAGHPVLTFDYPYAAEGRRRPDRAPVLLECHRRALDRLEEYGRPVVLAGKSMGGRMASHLAAGDPRPVGLVCLGYPLVSPSSGEERDTGHLGEVGRPMLFVSGSRDRLAPLGRLRPLVERLPAATLEVVPDADHGFRVPKRSGLDAASVLDRIAGIVAGWPAVQSVGGGGE
jgi:predicted alpha/beta-hydrolase family hydrolase